MHHDDTRIREFAYQIWESEGRPEGQQARHWDMAVKLAAAETLATPGAKTPDAKPAGKPPAAKKPRAPRKPTAS